MTLGWHFTGLEDIFFFTERKNLIVYHMLFTILPNKASLFCYAYSFVRISCSICKKLEFVGKVIKFRGVFRIQSNIYDGAFLLK